MEQEHDSKELFTTDNYGLTTSPAEEWRTVIECDKSKEVDNRKVPNYKELLERESSLYQRQVQQKDSRIARLTKEEIIAIVMYTGPMVCTLFRIS
jgi:hypothetical protein